MKSRSKWLTWKTKNEIRNRLLEQFWDEFGEENKRRGLTGIRGTWPPKELAQSDHLTDRGPQGTDAKP